MRSPSLYWGTVFFFFLRIASAQEATSPSGIELQMKSVEKQREAVRRQAGSATAVTHSFFTAGAPVPISGTATVALVSAATADVGNCDALPKDDVDRLVQENSRKHQVEPGLVRAVMKQESGFKPCAVSPKGAQGLMQLMPSTAQQFGVADPFDPVQNVGAGVQLLKQLLGRYKGDVKLALSAYNAGTAAVDKINAIPDIPETQSYVSSIVSQIE